MLIEAKRALEVQTVTAFDAEIASLINAGAMDLASVGVVLPGSVDLTVDNEGVVTDNSSLDDDYVKRAILTYVKAHFRNPPNREQLLDMYDSQKKKLANTERYTDWRDPGCTDPL